MSDLVITVANFKGGVGKTMLATQLMAGYGYAVIQFDPYGDLEQRYPDTAMQVQIGEPFPDLSKINTGRVIFDFGGFDDKMLEEALRLSDLVLIPFITTVESLQATIDTIHKVRRYAEGKPMFFVSNMTTKAANLKEALLAIREVIGEEPIAFELPFSEALRTSVNENVGVLEMAAKPGLQGFPYRPIAAKISDLHNLIMEVAK